MATAAKVAYRIYTDIKDQGTDGNVYLDLHGSSGEAKRILLDNPIIDDNEPGTSLFNRNLPDLGEILRGRIWHEGGSDFLLMQVRIEATVNGQPRGWRLANNWNGDLVTSRGIDLHRS
jgi:hypothetical protein